MSTSKLLTPAPNAYNIPGQFQFKDLNNPDSIGKLPKFAFGQKTVIKKSTLETPGPGQYETDIPPMN